MISDNSNLDLLREKIKSYMSEHRFTHTLGVEKAAEQIASAVLPERVYEARVAALLHDIAKELPPERQIELAISCAVPSEYKSLGTPAAIHSYAAGALIQEDFPEFDDQVIINAVSFHTLGAPFMSLLDKIIFIADYIEEGRKYQTCKTVRDYLLPKLSKDNPSVIQAIDQAVVMAIDFTEESLTRQGKKTDPLSVLTRNAILAQK